MRYMQVSKSCTYTNKKTYGKKAKKMANLFKNRVRSGGEENKRRMANNVMQEMRVYDGYLHY